METTRPWRAAAEASAAADEGTSGARGQPHPRVHPPRPAAQGPCALSPRPTAPAGPRLPSQASGPRPAPVHPPRPADPQPAPASMLSRLPQAYAGLVSATRCTHSPQQRSHCWSGSHPELLWESRLRPGRLPVPRRLGHVAALSSPCLFRRL